MPTALTETASPLGHNSKNATFTPPKPPATLPKLVHKDWQDLCHHLYDTGAYGDAKLPLMEVYLLALNSIREAQMLLAEEGTFVDGRPHPALGEMGRAATTMTKFSLLLNLKSTPPTPTAGSDSKGDDAWAI